MTAILDRGAVVGKAAAPRKTRKLRGKAPFFTRWRAMARAGIKMMFHDKLKLMGTMLGVVFAVVLSNQQAGTFMGLIHKNTMFVKNSGADIWVLPRSTEALLPGSPLSDSVLYQARVTPGVEWAEPLLFGNASVALPNGGTEAVTLIGTKAPRYAGGPWNMVAGDKSALAEPNTMIFEDSDREKLGALNLDSMREVSGYRTRVGGFTWGLIPFGPSYAFADYEHAREMLHIARDRVHFVLVKVGPNEDINVVAKAIQDRVPEAKVITRPDFERSILKYILTRTSIGITFGTSALFGLIVGFVIVSLSMFSAVVDNLREFGVLKAIGATTLDLAKLLLVQSVTYALMGSLIGLAAVSSIAKAIRSPQLGIVLPTWIYIGTTVLMVFLCIFASGLALLRLRKLEPAMVFR